MAGSLPEMMTFHDEHRDDDRFAIVAFHDTAAKTFTELDEKLVSVKEKHWKGRDLPFPILLDASGETIKAFGINAFPTTILIAPDGRLYGRARLEDLEKALRGELEMPKPRE